MQAHCSLRAERFRRRQIKSIALNVAASDDGRMEYLIGAILSLAVFVFALVTGLDRDRVFYPTPLAVIATYYILFAVMGASVHAIWIESLVAGSFLAIAVAGFRTNLWFVAAALAGHGVFDFFHHLFIENPGVPVWWPGFCLAFDIVAGGFLGVLLIKRPNFSRAAAMLRD
jgi:hypothetical protein